MSAWFRDGRPLTSVPVDDRGLHYGDGLFETIAVRGGKPRLWDRHMARLTRGCDALAIEVPNESRLRAAVAGALEAAGRAGADAVVKLIATAGESGRGYGRSPATATLLVGVFPCRPVARRDYARGVGTTLCRTRLATGSAVAGLKTLNRIEQVLGRSECLRAGVFEGLMLDADGRLICGTMSNVFLARDNRLITPSVARCGVAGVMRGLLMDALGEAGVDVDIRDIAAGELWQSDEVFLTNSQFGALPVRRCDDHEFRGGNLTQTCMTILAAQGIAECAP